MKTKFLGLPILQQKIPHYGGAFMNFGMIIVFGMIPTLLILWLGYDMFQNPNNRTTVVAYVVASLTGVVVQHIGRVLTNYHVKKAYSHWSNAVFMWLLFIVGFFLASDRL